MTARARYHLDGQGCSSSASTTCVEHGRRLFTLDPTRPVDTVNSRELAESEKRRRADAHHNGVHVDCRRAGRYASGWSSCLQAGRVERLHGHDFEGSLTCGCSDLAPVGVAV